MSSPSQNTGLPLHCQFLYKDDRGGNSNRDFLLASVFQLPQWQTVCHILSIMQKYGSMPPLVNIQEPTGDYISAGCYSIFPRYLLCVYASRRCLLRDENG